MKTRFLKSFTIEHKQRYGVALLLCVGCLLVALAPGAAQVRTPRRVTALQLDGAAEGSKVTIVSDVALNDYEAFRRGDRFYLKIPLADLAAAAPHLRADGFEDVQVQKVGDGLIVSFKLQPGATARVDQRANRLDVVFTAANRSAYLNSTRSTGAQGPLDRGRDTAGPIPADTDPAARDRFATGTTISGSEQPTGRNPWSSANSSKNSKGGLPNQTTGNNPALTSPSPLSSPSSSPSSILTPGTTSTYSSSPSSTPAVSPALAPSAGSSGMLQNWKQRGRAAAQWAANNRLATLLALLILLSLIVYLLLAVRGRKDKVAKAKQAKTPKVQPKYSAGSELNERPSPGKPAVSEVKKDLPARGSQSGAAQPASTSAAAASASHSDRSVLTKPTIAAPVAVADEHREEEEREVFEL